MQNFTKAIESAIPLLEGPAVMCGSIDVMAQVSLAISVKRIADTISNPSVHKALMHLSYPLMAVKSE